MCDNFWATGSRRRDGGAGADGSRRVRDDRAGRQGEHARQGQHPHAVLRLPHLRRLLLPHLGHVLRRTGTYVRWDQIRLTLPHLGHVLRRTGTYVRYDQIRLTLLIIMVLIHDRRIYLNLSKSAQSAAGLKAFRSLLPIWALLDVQIITLLFPFTVQKYIYPAVSKVHAWSFRVSVIHRTTGFLTCVRDYSYSLRVHTGVILCS